MLSFSIIPAAGKSRRMGQPKLLMPWKETTVIGAVIRRWQASRVDRIVVAARWDDEPLMDACRSFNVTVVAVDPPPPEMKDSVRAALRFVAAEFSPGSDDAWLLAPADMPEVSPDVVDRLLARHAADPAAILVPTHDGRNGHPVLFPWPLAKQVESLAENEGVNALLRRHAVRPIEAGRAARPADIDTPADYQRLSTTRKNAAE